MEKISQIGIGKTIAAKSGFKGNIQKFLGGEGAYAEPKDNCKLAIGFNN